jgi:rfaE bifunctional protein nucleotidyltransferase chain/domain
MATIYAIGALREWCTQEKALGHKIGFTCGAFDLLHAGHVDYLRSAKALCNRLIVAVNTDSSIQRYKSVLRPIVCETQRASVVAALGDVDAVILMDDQRPAKLLSILEPDLYIKGGDYVASQLRSAAIVESYGGKCIVIPVMHHVSTTSIVRRIAELALYAESEKIEPLQGAGLVFLDRDGTLIENVPYLKDPSKVRLRPGIIEGLRRLQEAGLLLVIVTNQQGIGLGYLDAQDFFRVNSEMLRQLGQAGIRIARIYFCPHSYAEQCECRKPGVRLFQEALSYYGREARDCSLIGDSLTDLQAAERLGCRGMLVSGDTGDSFAGAVQAILTALESRTESVLMAGTR